MDRRLLSLDLLRGVAATVVVLYHLGQLDGGGMAVPRGYLAVDFFFLLSGFVIARTYGERLGHGLSPRAFMTLRLVRLYPLYLLGLLLGLVVATWCAALPAGELDGGVLTASIGFNVLMAPTPLAHRFFPFNVPAWSLFFEVAVNGLFAVGLYRWRPRLLGWLLLASAVLILACVTRQGSLDGGFGRGTALTGAARCVFSFTLGILLHRSGLSPGTRPSWAGTILIVATLVAIMMFPTRPGTTIRPWLDLLAVMLVFPLLLVIAVRVVAPAWLAQISGFAGDLSYPVYALHYPVILAMDSVGDAGPRGLAWRVATLLVILLASWAALRWYDAPMRAWLGRRTRRGGTARSPIPA